MSTASPGHPLRARYDRWAPWLFLGIALAAVVGIWLGTIASLENGRQNAANAAEAKARDLEQRVLLACFDDYAAASSGSSTAVRAAAEDRDAATAARDNALQALVSLIVENATNPPTDETAAREEFLATVVELRDASRRLDKASDELQRTREENPVPKPPSQLCGEDS